MSRRAGCSSDPVDLMVGAIVKARRLKLGMSQTALGARVGVTFQQIQKYERGSNRVSASMLVKMADALHLAPADLLPGEASVQARDPDAIAFTQDPGTRPLMQAWTRLSNRQRREVVDLVLSLAQKRSGPT